MIDTESTEKLLVRFGKAYVNLNKLEERLIRDSSEVRESDLRKAQDRVISLRKIIIQRAGNT